MVSFHYQYTNKDQNRNELLPPLKILQGEWKCSDTSKEYNQAKYIGL